MIGIINSTELNFFILLYDKKNKMIKFNKNSILKNKKKNTKNSKGKNQMMNTKKQWIF
jgi:hypothetical protein